MGTGDGTERVHASASTSHCFFLLLLVMRPLLVLILARPQFLFSSCHIVCVAMISVPLLHSSVCHLLVQAVKRQPPLEEALPFVCLSRTKPLMHITGSLLSDLVPPRAIFSPLPFSPLFHFPSSCLFPFVSPARPSPMRFLNRFHLFCFSKPGPALVRPLQRAV